MRQEPRTLLTTTDIAAVPDVRLAFIQKGAFHE